MISQSDKNSFEVHVVWLNHHFKQPEVQTGTSGYNRFVKMINLEFSADYDSFEVHKVWLTRNFKRPEVISGTSGCYRSIKISDWKSTPSIYL